MTSQRWFGRTFIDRRMTLLGLFVAPLGLGFGACNAAPRAQFGSGLAKVSGTKETDKLEKEMFRLLNKDRRAAGLPPLAYDENLADVARFHSKDMRDNKFFEHISPFTGSPQDRLDASGYLFLTARENLSEAPDVVTSQAGLMKSPHHHENIMARDVTHVGVGIVPGGVHDPRNLTFTQLFATPAKDETDAQVRSSLLGAIGAARRKQGLGRIKDDARLNELSEEHIQQIDPANFDSSIASIGDRIPAELAVTPIAGVGAVLVGGQLLPDSSGFALPPHLLEARASALGLAVRRVPGPTGRPSWAVLLLVGLK